FVHAHVEAVEGPEQALRFADVDVDFFDLRGFGLTNRRQREAIEPARLIANDQPPLRVEAHRDPRALVIFRHRVEQFDAKLFGDFHAADRRGGRLTEFGDGGERLLVYLLAPRSAAERGDDL